MGGFKGIEDRLPSLAELEAALRIVGQQAGPLRGRQAIRVLEGYWGIGSRADWFL